MRLDHIILTNFKNYSKECLDFDGKQFIFLSGKNGMGKTNLLDAIYYLCMGKSYFSLLDKGLILHGETFFRVEAQFSNQEKEYKIVAKIAKGKKKVFECNNKAYGKLSEHIGLLPIVFIAPDDTALIREGSEARRKFLDNSLSQIDAVYLNQLILYNKILKQRNAALKQMAQSGQFSENLLQAYDQQLAPAAQYIFSQRKTFLKEFIPILEDIYRQISKGHESISCEYASPLEGVDFLALLALNREKDKILQRTTKGVHKDDLDFIITDYPIKKYGSQGQQKTFVIALKLAQYQMLKNKKNQDPILILDDIFDKLDAQRVNELIILLSEQSYGQVFITDTQQDRLQTIFKDFQLQFNHFKIDEGHATKPEH